MTITHAFAILWFAIFILVTSYSKLIRYQILEDNLDLSDEDVGMVMEVIEKGEIGSNITKTEHRNATLTKGTFKPLRNDTKYLGTN